MLLLNAISDIQDGHFQIQNVGSSKCLTAENGGTYTDQWDCLGESAAPHQTWQIVQSSGSASANDGGDGVFGIENVQYSGKCLNAADGIGGSASNLNVYDCDMTSPNQMFAGTSLSVSRFYFIFELPFTREERRYV